MGPRHFSRGIRHRQASASSRRSSFNGAAAFQPRNSAERRSGMILAGRFNGAAAFQPRNSSCVVVDDVLSSCFNGAAAFQPRNFSPAIDADSGEKASMGPRHFSRGILILAALDIQQLLASMGPRHFSRGIFTRRFGCQCTGTSFNGAAAFQPRNWPSS